MGVKTSWTRRRLMSEEPGLRTTKPNAARKAVARMAAVLHSPDKAGTRSGGGVRPDSVKPHTTEPPFPDAWRTGRVEDINHDGTIVEADRTGCRIRRRADREGR